MAGKRTSYITKAECLTIQTPIVIMKRLGNHTHTHRERERETDRQTDRGKDMDVASVVGSF